VRWLRRIDLLGAGLGVDVALYALSAIFAAITAMASTLPPHRAWGAVAAAGYGVAALAALGQWVTGRTGWQWRAGLAVLTFGTTTLVPLFLLVGGRAQGRTDRAQEEVMVIEDGARRLVETGSPYLSREAIAALPPGEQLLGYLPYQPGMAVFGLPRATVGATGATDARVWFALATVAAVVGALLLLRRAGLSGPPLVRALQAATVLPVGALTLATGGDDLPVLALCLLAFTLAAAGRFGWAGLAIGGAAALKLFAWPIGLVLGVYALTQRQAHRYAAGAIGVPVLTAVPALLIDSGAVLENVLAYPLGRGLVTSPAASPLPGHLIAGTGPIGRALVFVLLAATAVAIAVWLYRSPPRTAADAALVSGIGLLAAMLLLPATRFGYLLYPAVLLVWAGALRLVPVKTRGTVSDVAPA
jgi:Glycosyltransferase family 87